MTFHLSIDEQPVEVEAGATVLDAILAADRYVPHLCKDPDRPRIGSCRTCLVSIEGFPGLIASCTMPATEGMVVHTDDPLAVATRTGVLQLTIDMLPEDDPSRLGELGSVVERYGVTRGRFLPDSPLPSRKDQDDSNPFWILDHSRCILCQRCLDACQTVQHIGAIAMIGRDSQATIGTFNLGPIASSNCTSCGQCWATCPTLAIRLKEPVYQSTQPGRDLEPVTRGRGKRP